MSGIQFRRYELKDGAHSAFLSWYREIVLVRERCGFRLLFALDLEDIGEFVSAWAYDGDLAAVEAQYYNSAERRRLAKLGHAWATAHNADVDDEKLRAHPGFTRQTHITRARIEHQGALTE